MSTEDTENVAEEQVEEVSEPSSNNDQRTSYKLVQPAGSGRIDRIVTAGSPSNPESYVDFPGGVGRLTEEQAQAVRDAGFEIEEIREEVE